MADPFKLSDDALAALDKVLQICADWLPVARDCVAVGWDAQGFVDTFESLCKQATEAKARLAPRVR